MKYTINSKKGFYICDPCYVLSDEIYYDIWGGQHNYKDGEIPVGDTNFAVVGTRIGDGCYEANYNTKSGFVEVLNSVGVDSGTIAILPVEICKPDEDEIKFDYVGEVSIEYDDGRIYVEFGDESVMIDIEGEDDYWDEEEDDEDYDDVDPFDDDLFDFD